MKVDTSQMKPLRNSRKTATVNIDVFSLCGAPKLRMSYKQLNNVRIVFSIFLPNRKDWKRVKKENFQHFFFKNGMPSARFLKCKKADFTNPGYSSLANLCENSNLNTAIVSIFMLHYKFPLVSTINLIFVMQLANYPS